MKYYVHSLPKMNVQKLMNIAKNECRSETVPKGIKNNIILLILQNRRSGIQDYRTISLTWHAKKMFSRIII